MRSLRLTHPGPLAPDSLQLERLPLPEPGAGQVRLRVLACGVCHTDLHLVEGDLPARRLPVTPGHQVVGRVEAVGAGVTSVGAGARAGVAWLHSTCGRCEFCRRGEANLCPQARFTGWDVDGGYAEHMLADESALVPIPEAFTDVQAAPLLCAGIIGYRSLRRADLQPGERLGLFGFGASAHLALQVARHWGCPVSVFTRSHAHRALALQLGAEWAGGAEDAPPQLLDRAVIFAPAGGLVPQALRWLRPGGTLAINAIHMSPIPQMPYALLYGERTLRSVANATPEDARQFMQLAAEIPLHTEIETYPLAEAHRALVRLKHGQVQGAAVLVSVSKEPSHDH